MWRDDDDDPGSRSIGLLSRGTYYTEYPADWADNGEIEPAAMQQMVDAADRSVDEAVLDAPPFEPEARPDEPLAAVGSGEEPIVTQQPRSTVPPEPIPEAASRAAGIEPVQRRSRALQILSLLAAFLGGALTLALADRWRPEQPKLDRETLNLLRDDRVREADAAAASVRSEFLALSDQLRSLSERMDRIQSRPVEPAGVAESVAAQIRGELNQLSSLRNQVDRLSKVSERMGALSDRVGDLDRHVLNVTTTMDGLQTEFGTVRHAVQKPAYPSAGTDSAGTGNGSLGELFERGFKLLEQERYGEADALFVAWRVIDQQDPRAWYFSALTRGFTAGDWQDQAKALAAHGVELENSNRGRAPQVEAALARLAPASGRDWLGFYRRQLTTH
jgi:hypothetical protein